MTHEGYEQTVFTNVLKTGHEGPRLALPLHPHATSTAAASVHATRRRPSAKEPSIFKRNDVGTDQDSQGSLTSRNNRLTSP